jgi:hypothetical protein
MQIPRMYSRFKTIHIQKIRKFKNIVPKIWKYLKESINMENNFQTF